MKEHEELKKEIDFTNTWCNALNQLAEGTKKMIKMIDDWQNEINIKLGELNNETKEDIQP